MKRINKTNEELAEIIKATYILAGEDVIPLTPMSGFLVFLKDMRFTGSWDLPTLNRAIEVGETIAEQSLAVPPLGAAEPVAWQWRALEDGEPRTAWKDPELGDRPGWEALAKQNPEKYATERRALYSVPQPSDATPQAVAPTEEIGEIIERLKKWSDLAEFERILGHWDAWRKYIREGGGGSWPRDAFESLVDAFGQDGADAATALTALSAEHRRRGSKIIEMTEQIGAQMCRAESAEAMMEGSMANRITEKMVEAALDATGFRNAEYSRKWMRRALEAALSREPGQQEWQPIETAPTDEGVSVLLGWALEGNWPPCIGFWSGDYHGAHAWCDDATENDFTPQPTHWQPLPAGPAASRKALEGKDG